MDLRQLRYFVAIVKSGSFSQAAAALHLSQPTLGEHVRNLETELGVALLVRHSRGVTVTAAGRMLAERAEHLLAYAAETRAALAQFDGTLRGTVTLGISPGLNEMFAVDLIGRCRDAMPAVALNIVEDLSAVLVARMAADGAELKLALVSGYDIGQVAGLQSTPLALEQLYLVGTPQQLGSGTEPIGFAEVVRLPLIMLGSGAAERPHGLRRQVEKQATALGITLDISLEMRSVAAVKELVERQYGVAILPFETVRRRVEDGALVARAIVEPPLCRELNLVVSGSPQLEPREMAVRDILLALVAERVDHADGPLRPIGS